MKNEKADLIIHPVRLRIMQALGNQAMTTLEITNHLPDVPKSSMYRHLKLLLNGGLVEISETKMVNGIEEKTYRTCAPPLLSMEDLQNFTKADHLHYFSAYTTTLIQGFKAYLESAQEVDFVKDRVGYRELKFYASTQEFDQLFIRFQEDLLKIISNPPGEGRRLRKLVTIIHPEIEE